MRGNFVKVGDKVAYQHKKYKSTTPTISVGTVIEVFKNQVLIEDDLGKSSSNGYKQRKKHFIKL